MSSWSSPAALAVESRLFRALAVLRVVVLANTVAWNMIRADHLQRPELGAACVGLMVGWTWFAIWAYDAPRRRTAPLLGADLVITLAMLLSSPFAKGEGFSASVPGFWVMGALIAWAIHYRWVGGLAAGVVLAATDLAVRQDLGQSDYGNAFLLVIGGPILGYMCGSLQRLATERDEAERAVAVAAERARLARAVHDGVLQVLALVQRQGGELGRLAGDQESLLRTLIQTQDDVTASERQGEVDLAAELARLQGRAVTVSVPGYPVPLPGVTATELLAVAQACLDNVRRHVGEDAPAWVLLQSFPDRVELSVRDEGPGIPDGRLAEAAAQGRLGVAQSIRGRVADLRGTASLTTGPDGTEWELTVPLGSRS